METEFGSAKCWNGRFNWQIVWAFGVGEIVGWNVVIADLHKLKTLASVGLIWPATSSLQRLTVGHVAIKLCQANGKIAL